jgi:hypothetical protein
VVRIISSITDLLSSVSAQGYRRIKQPVRV